MIVNFQRCYEYNYYLCVKHNNIDNGRYKQNKGRSCPKEENKSLVGRRNRERPCYSQQMVYKFFTAGLVNLEKGSRIVRCRCERSFVVN